jgi:hypothetical protein
MKWPVWNYCSFLFWENYFPVLLMWKEVTNGDSVEVTGAKVRFLTRCLFQYPINAMNAISSAATFSKKKKKKKI